MDTTTTRSLLQFQPTNLSSAQSIFSPDRNGLQSVTFQIPKLPRVMFGKTLRINGTMKVFDSTGGAPSNKTTYFDAGSANTLYNDGRIGVSNCIDNISIQNLKGATYSNVKNYNRLCSSLVPLNQSFNNYINGVDDEYAVGKQVTQALKCDKPFDFSVPILDGFFMGENAIDMDLVDGLQITLTLAPSNFVLNNNNWLYPGQAPPNGAYYEWSDLVLSVETEIPDAKGQEAMMKNRQGIMQYKTYSSFYNVILSNQHNLTFMFNTKNTTAVIGNMVPSSWINNYSYNSSATPQLLVENTSNVLGNNAKINAFTYQKSGVRTPYDFEIVSETTQDEGTADSVKNLIELNSVRDSWDIYNFEKSLKTELCNPLSDTKKNKFSRERYSIVEEDLENQYNIGVCYDKFGNGIDFRGEVFSLRIQSQVPSTKSFQPHSLFLFNEHQNTLVFKDGMVQVLS
jgi:hypothetical protein